MYVRELIVRSAEALLLTQREDGSFPPGHNGPYFDEELPIRNTAHILVLMLKAFQANGDQKFKTSAINALSYITAEERRPMGATYWIRKNPDKDFANGLIGQAWVVEALLYAAKSLDDDKLHNIAEQVFMLHPFDPQCARWRIVNVDGSYAHVDMTFNHQLWFAAIGSYINGNKEIDDQINLFLDKLELNLRLYENGLIIHALGGLIERKLSIKKRLKQSVKAVLKERGKPNCKNPVINKAIGYHAFNTYAFGLIFKNSPDHSFWSSEAFFRMLNFIQTDTYSEGLEYYVDDTNKNPVLPFNRFGYPYNPPGIEVAYTIQTFSRYFKGKEEELIANWLGRQMAKTFDQESGLMNKNSDDKVTLAARMYEAVRLDNWFIRES